MSKDDYSKFRVTNSRGRVLLEVTAAFAAGIDSQGLYGVTYCYSGPGCGGNVSIEGLMATIETIKLDNPSAKITGLLPDPQLLSEVERG